MSGAAREDLGDIEGAATPTSFNPANGPVWASMAFLLQAPALLEVVKACVQENTQPALPVGKQCMTLDDSFRWPRNRSP